MWQTKKCIDKNKYKNQNHVITYLHTEEKQKLKCPTAKTSNKKT